MKNILWILPFLFCACVTTPETEEDFEITGMRPIYLIGEPWDAITVQEPQPIKNLGKIYYKDNHIFVNEVNKGIHVIDNTDPYNPNPIKFIKIWGSKDIAIQGNILYADNITDLVAVDISDLDNIEVTKRVTELYGLEQSSYPENYQGYFECVDATKGTVIGWEEADLMTPECFR